MKLSEYIEMVGDSVAADMFGVTERAAMSWRRLERSPRPEKAREIAKVTKNKVSFSDCFESRAA